MWHCLRLMDVRGPTLAEFEDPYLESGSRLYDAPSVGLATCDDSHFRAGFTTPHNRRTHQSKSQLGEESDRESTWSGRSTGLPQGFRLISEFKLQEMEEHLQHLTLELKMRGRELPHAEEKTETLRREAPTSDASRGRARREEKPPRHTPATPPLTALATGPPSQPGREFEFMIPPFFQGRSKF